MKISNVSPAQTRMQRVFDVKTSHATKTTGSEAAKQIASQPTQVEQKHDPVKSVETTHHVKSPSAPQQAEKSAQTNGQLMKRMEFQAAMHPAFHQVSAQVQAPKTDQTKVATEASKVSATAGANTATH